jgi:hypothetical protein
MNDLNPAGGLILCEHVDGAIERAVVGDDDEIDAFGEMKVEEGANDIDLITHQKGHNQFHACLNSTSQHDFMARSPNWQAGRRRGQASPPSAPPEADPNSMNLAILFWFYKDAPLCRNHLEFYRKRNPGVPIYGLFSGEPADAPEFESVLGPLLDDFYAFDQPRTDYWRWANGDLVIAEWYRARGSRLPWDSLFVAAWDVLVLAPVREVFKALPPDHILLSNVRPVQEVEGWWRWVCKKRPLFDGFMSELERRYGKTVSPWCCQFIVVCLPRLFLEGFAEACPSEEGFVEYRVPTYASILGIPFHTEPVFDTVWPGEPDPAPRLASQVPFLNPGIAEVPLRTVFIEAMKPGGQRIFHPVERTWPTGPEALISWIKDVAMDRRGRRPHRDRPRPHLQNQDG